MKFIGVLICWARVCSCFIPSEISYSHLHTAKAVDFVRSTLSQIGILAITDIPQLAAARYQALSAVHICLKNKNVQNEETNIGSKEGKYNNQKHAAEGSLPDGTIRRTLVLKNEFQRLSSCPEIQPQLELLRHLVQMTTDSVAIVLDKSNIHLRVKTVNGRTLRSFSQVVHRAKRLNHFHFYEGNSTLHTTALHMHVDVGIFIAFVPPFWGKQGNQEDIQNSGLLVQLPNGKVEPLILNKNTIILMVGMGAQTLLRLPFRPVPHSLQVPIGTMRAWYGHMVLFPEDMVIGSEQISFSKFWSTINEEVSSDLGCSSISKNVMGEKIELFDLATPSCAMGTTDCWPLNPGMICIPNIACPQGLHKTCNSKTMGMGPHTCTTAKCSLTCSGFSSPTGWCEGSTSMHMNGFTSIFSPNDNLCTGWLVVYLTLNTPWKFLFGCISAFVLGISWSWIRNWVRRYDIKKGLKFESKKASIQIELTEKAPLLGFHRSNQRKSNFYLRFTRLCRTIIKPLTLAVFLHESWGYLLMLLMMTYSYEITFSLILGTVIGKIFFLDNRSWGRPSI